MLSLGSSLSRPSISKKSIVKDNLALMHDYTNHGVHQVSTGAASFTAASNEYITTSNDTSLRPGTGSFSISCWVNSNQTGATGFVVGKGDGINVSAGNATGFGLYLGNTGTDWGFFVSDGTNSLTASAAQWSANSVNANQWYHLCGTFDGGKVAKTYIDGVLVGTNDNNDGSGTSTANLGDIDVANNFDIGRIGGSTSSDFDGYVCNVGFWKGRVLNQTEIKSIMWKNYVNLTSDEKTSLSSWWNLDSTIGIMTAGDGAGGGTSFVKDNHHGGGDELGSELLTNSSLSSNTTGWTLTTMNDTSFPTYTNTGTNGKIHQTITTVVGKTYKIDATVISGEWWIHASTSASSGDSIEYTRSDNSERTVPLYFTATGTTTHVLCFLIGGDGTTGKISDVSAKLVNGNTGTLS